MAIQQDHEWTEAQKIVISTDLIAAAKKQLQFLEAVDNNGNLYDGPILEKAIFRYKYCWLPLLAKHTESKLPECQLVLPLDCEWIWHCHRLNPVRYMKDCKELFGRILNPGCVVVSSIEGACEKQTEEIWKKNYPEEPYQLDFSGDFKNVTQSKLATLPSTDYDLISAVKRQSSFYDEVSRNIMRDDLFLEGAVQRYKGFLHVIRRNMEMKSTDFCVPTYDIDLMWHSHQLHPLSYFKDLLALLGKVLEHDDTDVSQGEGQKLNVGFTKTTNQWGEMFGSSYWRAGAMHRGTTKGMEREKLTRRCFAPGITKGMEGGRCFAPGLTEGMEGGRCLAPGATKDLERKMNENDDIAAWTNGAKCRSEVKGNDDIVAWTNDAKCKIAKLKSEINGAKCRSEMNGNDDIAAWTNGAKCKSAKCKSEINGEGIAVWTSGVKCKSAKCKSEINGEDDIAAWTIGAKCKSEIGEDDIAAWIIGAKCKSAKCRSEMKGKDDIAVGTNAAKCKSEINGEGIAAWTNGAKCKSKINGEDDISAWTNGAKCRSEMNEDDISASTNGGKCKSDINGEADIAAWTNGAKCRCRKNGSCLNHIAIERLYQEYGVV